MPPTAPPAPVRLGLGLAALGRPGYLNLGHGQDLQGHRDPVALQQQAWDVLDAAYTDGIRHFDAARSYGRAEEFLSGWLRERGLQRGDVTLSSKWGYHYAANWQVEAAEHEVKDHSAAQFDRQWPQSRAALGEWLGVYFAHSVTPDSPLLHDRPLLERLSRMREAGVTPGLSLSGPGQGETLERALALHVGGVPVFGAVQATWNLLEPSAAPALRLAHDAGWTVYIKEAVANGRLTARNPVLPAPLVTLARDRNTPPDALALAAVLAAPFADVVLSGATTVAQLRSNLTARTLTLTATEQAALARCAEPPQSYWQTRSALPWT